MYWHLNVITTEWSDTLGLIERYVAKTMVTAIKTIRLPKLHSYVFVILKPQGLAADIFSTQPLEH